MRIIQDYTKTHTEVVAANTRVIEKMKYNPTDPVRLNRGRNPALPPVPGGGDPNPGVDIDEATPRRTPTPPCR